MYHAMNAEPSCDMADYAASSELGVRLAKDKVMLSAANAELSWSCSHALLH